MRFKSVLPVLSKSSPYAVRTLNQCGNDIERISTYSSISWRLFSLILSRLNRQLFRMYDVGAISPTKDIVHFKINGNNSFDCILTWVVYRVLQIKNHDIKAIFNKGGKPEQDSLMKAIRELEKHHSRYVDGDKRVRKIKYKVFRELLNG